MAPLFSKLSKTARLNRWGGQGLTIFRRSRNTSPPKWGLSLSTGWWRWLRNSSFTQKLFTLPFPMSTASSQRMSLPGTSCNYWVSLQCSLLRRGLNCLFPPFCSSFKTTLWVAYFECRSKYEEIESSKMKVNRYTDITDDTYTKQQVAFLQLNFQLHSYFFWTVEDRYTLLFCMQHRWWRWRLTYWNLLGLRLGVLL